MPIKRTTSRVGIITLFSNGNYGNRLQNYAVSRLWLAKGLENETLVLDGESPWWRLRNQVVRILKGDRRTRTQNQERAEAFRRFDALINIRRLERISPQLGDEYDFFSVGSDQCWALNAEKADWFFLGFAPPEKRIALAPSMGMEDIKPWRRHLYRRGVSGFDLLSVREESAARIIYGLTGRNAEVLIDPTLMLDAEEWSLVADDELVPRSPYVLCYMLGDDSTGQCRKACEELFSPDLKLVPLSERGGNAELPAGPSDFLALVASASCVVTDSFHGVVFSLFNDRPTILLPRRGGEHMADRFATLESKLGLFRKPILCQGCEAWLLEKGPDYTQRLALERSRFHRFVDRAMTHAIDGADGACGRGGFARQSA